VDCDDGDAGETRGLLAVGGCEPIVHGFGVDHPYVCGGGMSGEIRGGLPPYRLEYLLNPNPPPRGAWTAPGFIHYGTVSGWHDVWLTVTDSIGTALDPAASFRANITNGCTSSPPRLPSPKIVNAPAHADPWANSDPAAAANDAVAANVAPSAVVPLPEAPAVAFKGTRSSVAATVAFVLLGLGFFTLGEQWRRRDS